MMRPAVTSILVGALYLATTASVGAERLALDFLPPDFPPSDVCVAAPVELDPGDLQETDDEGDTVTLDDSERLQLLARDIRSLTAQDAEDSFDFIDDLITWRAELDPEFAGIEEAFARVDLYLAAARPDELLERGLIDGITLRQDDLSNAQRVRLAQHYLTGLGTAPDMARAESLLIVAAFAGNANALTEILRLQLRGIELLEWDIPAQQTAQLAFGGMIGQINRGLCNRAERMAQEYTDGALLEPNPELAFAWRKFAADMGGPEASWRMVEHHLSATGADKDNAKLEHYLRQALRGEFVIVPADVSALADSDAQTEAEVRRILKFNHDRAGTIRRRSAVPFLELDVRLVSEGLLEDSELLRYLGEVAQRPNAPAVILVRLAREIALRKGIWKGRDEIIALLERAVLLDDPVAMTMLADIQVGLGLQSAEVARAEELLATAVSHHGYAPAMDALADLYRCRLPNSPLLAEAAHWSQAYRDAEWAPIRVSASDLAKYHPRTEPEAISRIQTLGLRGHGGSAADFLQYLQSDPLAADDALRFWAGRVSRSDVALEKYVKQEYDLALTAAEAEGAVELFRRVYLDVGAASGIDLAVVLIRDAARDPAVVEDIHKLLRASIQRGEGAAMRLLQRLTNRDPAAAYAEYADIIEQRGDFLAHMYAAPFVDELTFDRYMARAISLMSCSTKDVAEVADAFASRGRAGDVQHWTRIGLAMEGGHVLSKLTISDAQMAQFERGIPSADVGDAARGTLANEDRATRRLYRRAADAGGPQYDVEVAAAHLAALIDGESIGDVRWALQQYKIADQDVRRWIDARLDILAAFEVAAEEGLGIAQFELGLLLRQRARTISDLETSASWLLRAAESGVVDAMVEYGRALGFGIGVDADPKLAVIWLQKAETLGSDDAAPMIALLSAMSETE